MLVPFRRCLGTALAVAPSFGQAPLASAVPLLASGSHAGSEYRVIGDTAATWAQANAAAQALGSGWHLATVTSASEQAYLASLFASANLGVGQLWAGGLQNPDSNIANANWSWANGEPWSYAAWATANMTEPNDYFGVGSEGYLTFDSRFDRGWTWNDETLTSRDRLGFVAEREIPLPEPATLAVFGAVAIGAGLFARRRTARA